MTARGIPVQDLPENQDPEVAYMLNEQTGEKTSLRELGSVVESDDDEKPKKRGRPRKTTAAAAPDEDEPKELAVELGSDVDADDED